MATKIHLEKHYDKKIKINLICTKRSTKKEIKTKRKKERYMKNKEMFQQNYISIHNQRVMYQAYMTVRI